MFHRQYMHRMLMDSALGEQHEGIPAKLIVNHQVRPDFSSVHGRKKKKKEKKKERNPLS